MSFDLFERYDNSSEKKEEACTVNEKEQPCLAKVKKE